MTGLRTAVPYLIAALTLGVFCFEFSQPQQDWGRAIERVVFIWLGFGTAMAPAAAERMGGSKVGKKRGTRRRRRRSRPAVEAELSDDEGEE